MAEKDDVALPELGGDNNGQAAAGAPLLETAAPAEDTTKRTATDLVSSTVGSEAWNSRDLKSRPH